MAGSGSDQEKDPFDGVVFDDDFVSGGIPEATARASSFHPSQRPARPNPPRPTPPRPSRSDRPPANWFWLRHRRPVVPDGLPEGVAVFRRPTGSGRPAPPLLRAVELSWIFIALLVAFAAAAVGSWNDDNSRLAVFGMVVIGWLISLCLHEFSHAAVAYRGGDHSVATKGYLSFDIRRYAHPFLSFVLPALFVLIGGIGLPGGAVWINRAALRTRLWRCLVSLAGPAANLLCALACAVPFMLMKSNAVVIGNHLSFWSGLAFLGLLQLYAVFLNMLPVPGLDGWGAAEPYMRPSVVEAGHKISPFGIMIVFFVVFSSPWIGGGIQSLLDSVQQDLGVPAGLAGWGYHLMQFWSRN